MNSLVSEIYHERQEPGTQLCAQHALNSLLQGSYFTPPDLATIAHNLDEVESSYREPRTPRRSDSHNMDDTDSGLPAPEWISTTYLGMTITQAEQEGYSVFAIRPTDDDVPSDPLNPLPKCAADFAADEVPPPTTGPIGATRPAEPQQLLQRAAEQPTADVHMADLEDEDWELQRALQESLQGVTAAPPIPAATRPAASERTTAPPTAFEESAARQRDALLQAQLEQAEALRETLENESPEARRRRTAGEEEEEEMLRLALAASLETAREEDDPPRRGVQEPPATRTSTQPAAPSIVPTPPAAAPMRPPTQTHASRVLDDEDADLQAALRASLENMPPGFVVPPSPILPPSRLPEPRQAEVRPPPAPVPAPVPASAPRIATPPAAMESEAGGDEANVSTTSSPVQEKPPTMEELRKMRMARFGG
ncbi:hypothetical protein FRB99_005465 [Tulasnella sp. 403]|nr:hypothetical protein FRB99_005465 [Tulasnella sp. 403]